MAEQAPTSRAQEIEQAIIGSCSALRDAIEATRRVGPRKAAVLVHGETGTGKERMARLVHEHSGRDGRFLALNCAALPEEILESELFGHEKGAFTGAQSRKRGLFEAADGGTLFLDEVGEMSLALQAKLLRVLQEGRIRRVSGTREIPVDVRLVSATHRDLRVMAEEGGFRQDLLFRLAQYRIDLPPLRERGRDVVKIARHLLKEDPELAGEHPWRLCRDAERVLLAYSWPGNVRELRNVLLQVVVDMQGSRITARHLRAALPAIPTAPSVLVSDVDEAILDLVRARGELSGAELRSALVVSKSVLQRRLQHLVMSGELERVGASVGCRYRLPPWKTLVLEGALDERELLALRLVTTAGRLTRQMLSDAADLTPRTANRVLSKLVDAGVLVVEGGGRSRVYVLARGRAVSG